ncbi:MAG: flagellin [Thermacetogeniaceae bacterium]
MIINHNIAALNTFNALNNNTTSMNSALAKLSSGQRINSAADDAAGLAISQKMQGQISGLDQATRNSQDGISLIQTAEGALNETQSILQRMRELAVQSSNDTNTAADRTNIQSEVDQLATEITRISNTTEFNTQKLLNGGVKTGAIGQDSFQIGANTNQSLSISIDAMDAKTLGVARDVKTAVVGTTGTAVTGASIGASNTVPTGAAAITAANVAAVAASTGAIVADGSANTLTVTAVAANGASANAISINLTVGGSASPTATAGGNIITLAVGTTDANNTTANIQAAIRGLGSVNGVDVSNWTAVASAPLVHLTLIPGATTMHAGTTGADAAIAVTATNGGTNETVNVATNATSVVFAAGFNGLTLTKNSAATTAATFGVTTVTVANNIAATATFANGAKTADALALGGIDVTTQANASTAITTIDTAINTVSAERATLGALQNRLQHTINNLSTSSQNLTSANSRIVDVDMAKEMSEYTKDNILTQAATAMLAQANQAPQSVLTLLK